MSSSLPTSHAEDAKAEVKDGSSRRMSRHLRTLRASPGGKDDDDDGAEVDAMVGWFVMGREIGRKNGKP